MLFDLAAPKYLIRDRDKKYGTLLGCENNQFGIDEKDSLEGRAVQSEGMIDSFPVVNGLHHVYFRQAS